MQAHSTVVVVSETVLSICPCAVLRRRFFLIESVEEAKRGVEGLKEGVTDAFLTRFFYENSTMKMCHSLDKL